MGRKKKFIDKKNSSNFQLIARDTSDPNYDDSPGGDRIFIQVSGRPNDHPDSIFADAPEDEEGDHYYDHAFGSSAAAAQPLPEELRKEILDLGFPDDGYWVGSSAARSRTSLAAVRPASEPWFRRDRGRLSS